MKSCFIPSEIDSLNVISQTSSFHCKDIKYKCLVPLHYQNTALSTKFIQRRQEQENWREELGDVFENRVICRDHELLWGAYAITYF